LGSLVVLVGILAFVVGCFIPSLGSAGYRFSIYVAFFSRGSGSLERLGVFLLLFSGAVLSAAISLVGILLRPRIWLPPALLVAVTISALTWTGFLLTLIHGRIHLFGYWLLLGSLVVGVAGAIVPVTAKPSLASPPSSS
jgi:hypothetical protein